MDELFELPLDTLPRRVRDEALKLYLYRRKRKMEIPTPLQAYIDWGIERQLNGDTPYPASKGEKENPYLVDTFVKALVEGKGWDEKYAVEDVAEVMGLTVRQVRNIRKRIADKPLVGVVYYVSNFMGFSD